MEQYLQVGVITSTHGIRGEVKVFPTTDDPQRFKKLKKVFLDTGREKMPLEVAGARFFKNLVIVKFKGIDNINEIEKYRQCALLVDREEAVDLQEDEYFIADLLGMEVYADGEYFGNLKDVMETGANEVYVIESEKHGEVLLPRSTNCILSVDTEERKMEVRLLDGLWIRRKEHAFLYSDIISRYGNEWPDRQYHWTGHEKRISED